MKSIFKATDIFPLAAILCVLGLLTMPGNLLNAQIAAQTGPGISVKNVNSIIVDQDNMKWFSTDAGIISFDGLRWKLYNENDKLPKTDLKSLTIVSNSKGAELWIASPDGASVTRLPVDDQAEVLTYNPDNASLMSQNVLALAAGLVNISWVGTDKGISAKLDDTWLTPDYDGFYTERMFTNYPITSMATNPRGDTLYVGTSGIGVARVYRDQLDGISGASVYAQWGPIDLPSDNIRSIYIAQDGTKWFGTEAGIARHTGDITLDNWTVYTTDDGLVDNYVQAICGDKAGRVWFGTSAGLSVFDGTSWTTYTTDTGLVSNNILSLATDQDDCVWVGTDAGINAIENGQVINF
jgi:ligand-binding sensor domain-containing protein